MTELGTVLDGKYEILKKVGQGGMSIVYLAMDNRLNKQWAVKEIKNDGSKSVETLLKGLEREANILKNVDHPVLPRIVDIINENNTIYVIMDFVEGKPLSDVLKEEGAQDQNKVIEWGRALASALDYLHSMNPPIIYRDMKPSNVMLKPDGSVKLIDFGTAKEYVIENNADTTALGTRGYAAPEQFGDAQGRGIYNTDARTDIYNLGATLYHLVTGKNPCEPPYEIKPIRQWNPMLSSGFEQIINKCCQASPNDRYQSCSELLYALDHYNELDNEYRAASKKKFAKFTTMAALSLVSVAVAIAGGLKKRDLKEQDYNNKVMEAEEALQNDDVNEAISCYKEAIELDQTKSDAYIGLIDTYAYYYDDYVGTDVNSTGAERGAEIGVRYAAKYVDKVQDDVKYEIAIVYYNEVEDYKTAMKYFNDVEDEDKFPDEVEQASYYSAICENKMRKNASFANSKDDLFNFEEYNSNVLAADTNTSKYVNYYNIASIYVENLGSDVDDMPARTIALLTEANENLDKNATSLSKLFVEERGVKYYTGQYAKFMYEVYVYQAENTDDTAKQQEYYLNAINILYRYLNGIDPTAEDVNQSEKKAYYTYLIEQAETYVDLAVVSGDKDYYKNAEDIYKVVEEALGSTDDAADVYVSHLNYLYNRYIEEYGTNPKSWKQEGKEKVKNVCASGNKVAYLAQRENNLWNSLIVNSVISAVNADDDSNEADNSEE